MATGSTPIRADAKSVVETFFAAKESHDMDRMADLFADDVVYVFPLPASGKQEDWFVYDGKDATMAYQRKTSDNFSQLIQRDRELTISEDGTTAFMESRGDYITTDGRPYHNVYMFKFTIVDGKIHKVREYCNPVTAAEILGLPIADKS